MDNSKTYHAIERAVTWIAIMLLAEFVLGVLLTTVVGYNPHKRTGVQTGILIAHALVGIGLVAGSLAHIFTSRKAQLLGVKPILGFVFIVGAFASGGVAASNGSNVAVLFMALFFVAAFVTYGLSYVKVKSARSLKV